MRKLPTALLLLVAVGGGTALAAGRDSYVRRHISWNARAGDTVTGASISFLTPGTWVALRSPSKRALRFRNSGNTSCHYTTTIATGIGPAADDGQSPAARLAAAVPAAGPRYVLDSGTRGTTGAWRVVRVPSPSRTDFRVRLRAMRVDRRSLAGGGHFWQQTTASAISGRGDECHSGTWREVLGPQIGDALATARGHAYRFTSRS